jgi:hypothetical protein
VLPIYGYARVSSIDQDVSPPGCAEGRRRHSGRESIRHESQGPQQA